MKKTNKGFTLVELLAVIVILAIIMIIAIPAVLQTMQSARQKTFKEYVTKVYTQAQNSYLAATQDFSGEGKAVTGITVKVDGNTRTCTGFNVKDGLGFSSTGEYEGAVLVCPGATSSAKINVLVRLTDKSYSTKGWVNYTSKGEDFDLGSPIADRASYALNMNDETAAASRKFEITTSDSENHWAAWVA